VGGVGAGGGVGAAGGMTRKSKQEMNVSGAPPQAPTPDPPAARCSCREKDSVFFPRLLKSLQVLPVFHSHRPTALYVGQENEEGTLYQFSPLAGAVQAYIVGWLGKKPACRSNEDRSKYVHLVDSLILEPHATIIQACPLWSAVRLNLTLKSVPGTSSGTGTPA